MRLKTLRIKVEKDNQDFDMGSFFQGSNTLHKIDTQLVKEGEDYYWHAFITYDRTSPTFPQFEKKVLPAGFEAEVENFISEKFPTRNVIKRYLMDNINTLVDCKSINDIKKIRNLGAKRIADNLPFLEELLEIIKKYNPSKEE